MLRLLRSTTFTDASSPRSILCPRQRRARRRHLTQRILFVIKPTDETDSETKEAEVVDDDDLPDYVPDPLLNAGPPDADVDIATLDPVRRTTRIIVDLVNAGSLFEDKLEEYRDYLDLDLLEKFYKRIEWAERYENESAAEGLRMIWRRVRAEVERKNASPALRLLDQLLALLHPSAGGTSQDRYRSALGLLYEALTQSQMDTVDIFGLAESLAEGAPPPSGLLREFVQKEDFIRELEEILDGAEASERELMNRKSLLLQQRTEADANGKELRVLSRQLSALDKFMEDRRQSLRDVEMLLDMARAI